MTPPSGKTAPVAEDEGLFRPEVADLLEAEGYAVVEAVAAVQALERLDDAVPLLVTDVRMPGVGAADTMRPFAFDLWPGVPTAEVEAPVAGMRRGITHARFEEPPIDAAA